jgi:uncharacterized membrane protein YcaP (DUF421 family)
MIWSDLLIPGVPWIEKIVRPLVVYVALFVLLRLFGKRELAQLNPYDLIVLMTISNTVQNAIIGNDNSVMGGLLGALTLLIVNMAVVRFLHKHEKIDALVEGDATVLVEKGCAVHAALEKEMVTIHELEAAAHKQGFASLSEVDRCILEPGGTLAMIGRKPSEEDLRQQAVILRLEEIKQLLSARGLT